MSKQSEYHARQAADRTRLFRLDFTLDEVVRFLDLVRRGPPTDCWPWKGPRTPFGHGVFRIRTATLVASRVAYALRFGAFDLKLDACHRCDNPPCCNPDHLFLGTQSDNARDMVRKGRQLRLPRNGMGERNTAAKLSDARAAELRRRALLGESQRVLATEFGVCQQLVSQIKLGKTRGS